MNLSQQSTEFSAPLHSDQHLTDNNSQYLRYLQHTASRPYEHDQYNNTLNQRQYYRYTIQQPMQGQQRRYNEEQELTHQSMQQHQQHQQSVLHFVHRPYYQCPGGWYYPGHGGGRAIYYVQGQEEEHYQQQGFMAGETNKGL
jgi:hypothetical protein